MGINKNLLAVPDDAFMPVRDDLLYSFNFNQQEQTLLDRAFKIKACLLAAHCMSEHLVYDSLNDLHNLDLSFKLASAADIGNLVSGFKHHDSIRIQHIADTLIASWMRKAMFCDPKKQQKTTKPLKVQIKVMKKVTARAEVLSTTSKGGALKKTTFNADKKNANIDFERATGQVKLIHLNAPIEQKLEMASRKLVQDTTRSQKTRSIKLLQPWEVNTPLPPDSQLTKSSRFRR